MQEQLAMLLNYSSSSGNPNYPQLQAIALLDLA